LDALPQFFKDFGCEPTLHPRPVHTLDLVARMHQAVGELARVGEKQQPGGIEVEPPDCNPAARRQL
jgi:hypothetical protein